MTITDGHVRATFTGTQREAHTAPVRIVLSLGAVMGLTGERRGLRLHCHTGRVWLTQQGDSADHVLSAGDDFVAYGKGRLVLQALMEAVVSLSPVPNQAH